MEDKKCCGGEVCDHNNDHKGEMCCGHKCCMGKYHILKMLICIFVLVVVFCFGVRVGSRFNGFRGNWGWGPMMYNYSSRLDNKNSETGSVTVKVLPPENKEKTTTPPVLQ